MISEELFERACKVIPGGVNSPVRAFRRLERAPFFVTRAQGAHLWDEDGRQYIDYVGTWGPAILGHAPKPVLDAVMTAVPNGLGYGIPTRVEVDMAETVCRWVPSIQKVRMTNSGTEATMSAVRLARGYTGRKYIIKFEGCYHGHVDSLLVSAGSGALTHGEPDSAGVPAEFAALTIALPYNDVQAVKDAFKKYPNQIAGVIVEPYPGNAGFYLPKPGYLEFLRDITEKEGALLIFDEVMTGFRISPAGVQGRVGITPDLTTLGKVIGGGLPVGAFGGRADIMTACRPSAPSTRREHSAATPWPWRRGSPSSASWSARTPTNAWNSSARVWKRVSAACSPTCNCRSPSSAAAPCGASSSPRRMSATFAPP